MTLPGIAQFVLALSLLAALAPLLGGYMTRVFSGQRTWLSPLCEPVERGLYRMTGVSPEREMSWKPYALAVLCFTMIKGLILYAILRLQYWLPFNPNHLAGVSPSLALNTAVSFITNTNWQNYAGETTMSYFSQMSGLAVQQFLSAAAGIAVAIALIRGIARKQSETIGNFWADMTRAVLYILLPISFLLALFFVSRGVIQNFKPNLSYTTVQGQKAVLPMGPVASMFAIENLGTNGGGFFNANTAHPFEGPTPLSSYAAILAFLVIGSSLTYTLGQMTGHQAHGWAVWAAMAALVTAGFLITYHYDTQPNPLIPATIAQAHGPGSPSRNLEGKETRFGMAGSDWFAVATTNASCGNVNSGLDSFAPLAGGVLLLNMMLGCVGFGGVGAGLYGMLMYILVAVFIAGLMIGRTPEYLGKKIEAREIKLAMLAVLAMAALILVFSALGAATRAGQAGAENPGPHGFSEILYAFASPVANNGSAFAGLNGNTRFYNWTQAICMFLGRFLMIIPVLAIAGSLARKKITPPSAGTLAVHTPLFASLLVGVILLVGALNFFPALTLGPVLEHFMLQAGRMF